MKLLDSKNYCEDIERLSKEDLPFNKLKNKSILITGACGLIGSFFIDTIMYLNREKKLNCHVYAMGLTETDKGRFPDYVGNKLFDYISHDVNEPLKMRKKMNFIIHLASNTHPVLYATHPISTITTNVIGTKNMLDYAVKSESDRFIFASSNEIYVENRGDVELFD